MESDQTGGVPLGVPLGVPQAGQVIPPRTPTICHSPPILLRDSWEVLVCYICPFFSSHFLVKLIFEDQLIVGYSFIKILSGRAVGKFCM